jgi:hypothetical protein
MLKRFRFWLWAAVVFLFLTALIHSLTLFIQPTPLNETERQLFELMVNYRTDFGAGFKRSTRDLVTALSACFSLVCLLGGLTLGYLARQQVNRSLLKNVVGIHLLVFGLCFGVMAVFTFLPPIVLTGTSFFCLLMTYVLMPRTGDLENVS